MGYGHAIEIPLQNPCDGFASSFTVANSQPDQAMWAEVAAASDQCVEEPRILEIRRYVEHQIGENRGPAGPVKKYHLVQARKALEQMLIDFTGPCRLRLVCHGSI